MLTMMNKIRLNSRVFGLLLLALILSLYGAWIVNAQFGYGYSWLYEFYETEEHIAYYAPQNNFRTGFEETSVAQHKEVFQKIVDSVHDDGKGLGDITYDYAGKKIPLLHRAEIIHLQDVATLINQLHIMCLIVAVIFMGLYFKHWKSLRYIGNLINGRSQLAILSVLIILITSVFFIFGAKSIFYQMHILIFPDDHQWFFYYQDSLMSTLMKAPDLFAGIAVLILSIAVVVFSLGLLLNQQVLKKRVKST
jgi:hypothetical protein